jgi:hypothetical protein
MKHALALLVVLCAGCGGSKATAPSNTSTSSSKGSAAADSGAPHPDCMEGGVLLTATRTATCAFYGEVMGAPKPDGTPAVHKCCYPTAEAACKNTSGCEVKDCTFDAKATAPTEVSCKDTTHGGVGPTNP